MIVVVVRYLIIILLLSSTALAQWEPLDVSRGAFVELFERTNSGTNYVTTELHVFRRDDADTKWQLVDVLNGDLPIGLSISGDSICVLAKRRLDSGYISVAYVTFDNSFTWSELILGAKNYQLMPGSMKALALLDCEGAEEKVEFVELHSAQRDTVKTTRMCGGEELGGMIVGEHNIVLLRWKNTYANYLTNISHADEHYTKWVVSEHYVSDVPYLNDNRIVCAEKGQFVADTLLAFNGDKVDTIDLAGAGADKASHGRSIMHADSSWYAQSRNYIYKTENGKNWNVVDSFTIAGAGSMYLQLLHVENGRAYFKGFSPIFLFHPESIPHSIDSRGTFFYYDMTRDTAIHTVSGLSQYSSILEGDDKLICTSTWIRGQIGFNAWREDDPIHSLTEKRYSTYHSRYEKVVGNYLWQLGTWGSTHEIGTQATTDEGNYVYAAASYGPHTIYVRGDSVYVRESGSSSDKLIAVNEFKSSMIYQLVTLGDTIGVFRNDYDSVNTVYFGLFDKYGYLISENHVCTLTFEPLTRTTTAYKLRDQLILTIDTLVLYSTDRGVNWKAGENPVTASQIPKITTQGIWMWDSVANGFWHTTHFDSTWKFYNAPGLPNTIVREVFCTPGYCYTCTEAGVYRMVNNVVGVANEPPHNSTDEATPITYVNGSLLVAFAGELIVSDLNGHTVTSENVGENSSNVVRGLASGAYYCVLNSNGRLFATLILHIDQ